MPQTLEHTPPSTLDVPSFPDRSEDARRKVTVVYLSGAARSGTTLLCRVMGACQGYMAVGEMRYVWTESLTPRRLCSCGASFDECAFWTAVMSDAFGDLDRQTLEHINALRKSVQSTRHLPSKLFPRMRTPAFKRRLNEYVTALERVYQSIQNVSGCDVIVDSSKLAMHALALAESETIDVRFVRVVRDSRACAYSWGRRKRRAVTGDDTQFMRRQAPLKAAAFWNLTHIALALTSRRFSVSEVIRYEDFVRQPRGALGRLSESLSINASDLNWTSDEELLIGNTSHIFAGNPNRLESGPLRFRADEAWRTSMPWSQRAMVTIATLPALWRFGYLRSRSVANFSPRRGLTQHESLS